MKFVFSFSIPVDPFDLIEGEFGSY
jgi:hypothetical protein